MTRFRCTLLACALMAASSVLAQQPASTVGTVTGHVLCADTHLAAHFASVSLIRKMPPYDPKKVENGSSSNSPKVTTSLTVLTSGQGEYTIQRVPPGDYYLVGMLAGYILPVGPPATEADATDVDKAFSELPLLHVAADRTVCGDHRPRTVRRRNAGRRVPSTDRAGRHLRPSNIRCAPSPACVVFS